MSLRLVAAESGMEFVVVRPPLVYGFGAPDNFATLLRTVRRGLPLPLGAIDNRRSLVAIGNLVDLLAVPVQHEAAAGQTLLVSDGVDLSTTELPRALRPPSVARRDSFRCAHRGCAQPRSCSADPSSGRAFADRCRSTCRPRVRHSAEVLHSASTRRLRRRRGNSRTPPDCRSAPHDNHA